MPIQAEQLLQIWEQGRAPNPVRKALALLQAAEPRRAAHELAALTVGRRDRELFALRESAFGSRFACSATCPDCGAKLESQFGVRDISLAEPAGDALPFRVASGEFQIECRAPTSADLIAVEAEDAPAAALLRRCVLSARRGREPAPFDALPEPLREEIAETIRERDPWSAVELAFSCPACGRRWTSVFDIVSYFWAELQAWARRVLREVHAIASVYGWRESDILALPPRRRQAYLELIGQ